MITRKLLIRPVKIFHQQFTKVFQTWGRPGITFKKSARFAKADSRLAVHVLFVVCFSPFCFCLVLRILLFSIFCLSLFVITT